MIAMAYVFSLASLLLGLTLFPRFKPPYNFMLLWIPQLVQHALSPLLVVLGGLGAALGWIYDAPVAVAIGLLGAGISAVYIWRVMSPEVATVSLVSGTGYGEAMPMSEHRTPATSPSSRTQEAATPRLEQDVVYWTVPGSGRQLLCDIWQPAEGAKGSGLALIFLHGSGWYLSDKDFMTRPFFRRLTEQGHVIMDVAYRLCPEVDIHGMVDDVKHAVAWMKTNAETYGVNPGRIVLAGASAGGHLALLAAYAPQAPELTPLELQGSDLTVRAVISLYGPTDLKAVYRETQQERVIDLPPVEIGQHGAADKEINFQDAGRLDTLLGGHLHEVPEAYELASPITHVHSGCPPTLLIHGDLDCITPTAAVRELYEKLVEADVPAKLVVYPLTQHAFDLLLPRVSPPARQAIGEVEQFVAQMV